MIIKLKDGTQFIESKENADKIKSAISAGAVGIDIDDKWFRADWVASIMPGGQTEADRVPENMRLDKVDHRGEPSPAKEALREKWGK